MTKLILQMKGVVIISAMLFFCPLFNIGTKALAQQLPFSSQYYINQFVINPAFTGNGQNVNAYLSHRSQWTGLAGSPQTSYLTVDGPIQKNSGLGLKVYTDVTDIISRVGAFAEYSYRINISDSNNLYFGIAAGILDNKLDFSKAIIKDTDDPFLFNQSQHKTVFCADLGVAYIYKRLSLGFAVPQVLGNRIKYPILNGDNSYYNLTRHYQGSIKYVFDVVKEKGITAYPLIMFRSIKGAPFQYDINAVVDWKKIGWAGLTYHSNYAMAISAGLRYKNFSVGYAYDLGLNKVRSYTGSSSEFLIGYTFAEIKKDIKIIEPEPVKRDTVADVAKTDTNKQLKKQIEALDQASKAKVDSIQQLQAQIKDLNTKMAKIKKDTVFMAASTNNEPVAVVKTRIDTVYLPAPVPTDIVKTQGDTVRIKENTNSGPVGVIYSRLLDDNGTPVRNAQIEVVDSISKQVVASTQSNNDGYFRISVPSGKTYDIVFSKTPNMYKSVTVAVPETPGFEKDLKNITVPKFETGRRIVLNNVFFDNNKADLKKESYQELERVVKLMEYIPTMEIELSGHTDNVGRAEFNRELSEQRAKVVRDYLVKKGADKNRLTYKGYGPSQMIASNTTEKGRILNRRTEFKVTRIDSKFTVLTASDTIANSLANKGKDPLIEENERLRAELAKAKSGQKTQPNSQNNELIEKLKAESDAYAVEVNRLRAELANSKNAGTATTTNAAGKTETDLWIEQLHKNSGQDVGAYVKTTEAYITQLKAKTDSSQIEINRLRSELAKKPGGTTTAPPIKSPETTPIKSVGTQNQKLNDDLAKAKEGVKNAETALDNKLKEPSGQTPSTLYQLQVDQLKSKLAKAKDAETKAINALNSEKNLNSETNNTSNSLVERLKEKSDSSEAQIVRLKVELAKAKEAERKAVEALNAKKSVSSPANSGTKPAAKAPVKKAPVKKTPAKKAPVKKAPAKKAPEKKAPVKFE